MASDASHWPGEEIEYLEEILNEYKRYVENIGENGLSAPLLLYYRDELEETLRDLEGRAPLQSYWAQTVELDNILRERSTDFVAEIGWESYRIQREARKPPQAYWWWHLDTYVPKPSRPNPVKTWWDWLQKP
jgi:hypothetical protein